jgi:hypothetical protein
VFIVLGRLGCKQVIHLGDVYVFWWDPHVAHHTLCMKCRMPSRSLHFGSSTHAWPHIIIFEKTTSMLEFLAGWLICALTVFTFYLWSEYIRHRRNDQHLLDVRFRTEHPAKHKAKAALRK